MQLSALFWIIASGMVMSGIALLGATALLFSERLFHHIVSWFVGMASGALIGGAIFHLLPEAIEELGAGRAAFLWFATGFVTLFALEQFLHWHHCRQSLIKHQPVGYLILFADSVHNLIGGIAIGAAYLIDIKLGILTCLIAISHEIPQELGDFGILVKSGWKKSKALLFNFLSGLTFFLGALISYFVSTEINIAFLLAFGAGNFMYIGASDLVPLLRSEHGKQQVYQSLAFLVGMALVLCATWL